MAGFNAWLGKLAKNARKNVFFLKIFFYESLVGKRSIFNCYFFYMPIL